MIIARKYKDSLGNTHISYSYLKGEDKMKVGAFNNIEDCLEELVRDLEISSSYDVPITKHDVLDNALACQEAMALMTDRIDELEEDVSQMEEGGYQELTESEQKVNYWEDHYLEERRKVELLEDRVAELEEIKNHYKTEYELLHNKIKDFTRRLKDG
jgi:DNA repair ATPase RecN